MKKIVTTLLTMVLSVAALIAAQVWVYLNDGSRTPYDLSIVDSISMAKPGTLQVSPVSKTLSYNGGRFTITVQANKAWTATVSDPTALMLSTASGLGNGTLACTAVANGDEVPYSAVVTFTLEDGTTIDLPVTVEAAPVTPAQLTISPTSRSVGASGERFTVTVSSNKAWSVSCDQPWVTLSTISGSGNGSFSVLVAANESSTADNAVITVITATGNASQALEISREGGAGVIMSEICDKVYKLGGNDEVMLTVESALDGNGQVTDVVFTVAPHGATSSAWIRGNETTQLFMALASDATCTPSGSYTQTVHFPTPVAAGTQVTFVFAWGTDLQAVCWEMSQTYTLGGVCCVSGDHVSPTLVSGAVTQATNTQLTLAMTGSDQNDCGRTIPIAAYEVTYGATTEVFPVQTMADSVLVIDGLTPGTAYACSVVAIDRQGNRSNAVTVNGQTWQHSIPEYCNGQTVGDYGGSHEVSLVFDTQWSGTPQASSITGFTVEIFPITEPGARFRNDYITGQEGLSINGTSLVRNTDYTLTKTSPTVGTINFTSPIAYDPANPPLLTWGCTEWSDVAADGTVGGGRYTNIDYSIVLGGNCCRNAEDAVSPVLTAVSAQGISDTKVEFTFAATDRDACGYVHPITQAMVTYAGQSYPIQVENGKGVLGGLNRNTRYDFSVTVGDLAGNFSNSLSVSATTTYHSNSEYCGYVEKPGTNQAAAFTVESLMDGSGQVTAIVVDIEPAGSNTSAAFRLNGIRTSDLTVNDVVVPVTATFNDTNTRMVIAFATPISQHDVVKWFLVEWLTSEFVNCYDGTHEWVYTAGSLCR